MPLFTFIRLCEQIAQPIKPAFPHRAAIADPLLHHCKPGGFNAAGAYPPDLFGLHQPAFLQHLQVLNYRGQSDVKGSANRETDMGPSLSFSIIARRLGSPRAWKTRSILGFFGCIGPRLPASVSG